MRQVYYGWIVVAIAMVIYALVVGSSYAAFGIFVHPVSKELGLTRAEMNTALILMNLGNAIIAPILGPLLDRLSLKRVMMACGVVLAVSLIGLGLSRSIILSSIILAVVFPVAYLGGCSMTLTVLIARWFTAQRGRAMTLAGVGMSLGNVIVTPAMGFLVKAYDWRIALVVAGAAIGSLVFVLALILRDRPGPNDVETMVTTAAEGSAQQPDGPPLPLKVIFKTPQFWLISLSTALALSVFQTIVATLIPLAQESGIPLIQATALMSVLGAASIAGGLSMAVFADKVDRPTMLAVLFLGAALVNGLLLLDHSYAVLATCAVVLGLGAGTVAHLFYALLADRFGTATFGALRGLTLPMIAVTGMIAIRFAGEVFDRTKTYDLMFVVFIGATVLAAVLMFATRFTRSPLATATVATSAT